LRTYELMVVLQGELEEDEVDSFVELLQNVVTENGGQVVDIQKMGKRRLAYLIQHQRDGYYVLCHLKLDRLSMSELERRLKLSEQVLRHLLIRLEETEEVSAETEPEEEGV